ncbi:hypothetical protein TCAL_15078 [Tigriopus californicus]|uniref:Fibronectin type-III domain-containing protein n=1 Tax=Tigriopus californicus TaxID=6832 RepID=A0A553NUG1_TIGCA|nr:hypothetical protein TCAL_15078 [Tigriopus californicus]
MASIQTQITTFALLLLQICPSWSGCPFQNPFWFAEKPMVVPVLDEQNSVVPNKIRLMWGRMENFKCVDYFQVEYFQRQNPGGTVQMTSRINRHRRSVEIDVIPCTEYFFKVIASEDWKGMREDFKMFSEVVGYKLEYTPKFITPPTVTERRKGEMTELDRRAQRRRERQRVQQQYHSRYGEPMPADDALAPQFTEAPEEFTIKVSWKLSDIDYPECLSHFVIDYYDTLYNETGFSRTIGRPFQQPNVIVPCELDYEFYLRVFGLTNDHTLSYWTPPSCIVTTPAPTSTTELPEVSTMPQSTTPDLSEQMAEIEEENQRLQSKIDGLKQEYEKIGLQVFHAFKESFFQGLEDFLARRRSETDGVFGGGGGGGLGGGGGGLGGSPNNTEALFG